MKRQYKRILVSTLWGLAPYVSSVVTFLDPILPLSEPIGRFAILSLGAFGFFACYTYPGWDWD